MRIALGERIGAEVARRRRTIDPIVLAVWCATPVVAALVVDKFSTRIEKPIAILFGIGFLVVAARRPGRTLVAMIILLPFEQFILGFLFGIGVPGAVLRLAGYWKEAVVAAIAIAAVRNIRIHRRHIDWLDATAIAYLLVVLLYYLLPHAFHYPLVPPSSASARQLGLREDALFVFAFLAARHARIGLEWAERIAGPLLIVGAVVSGIGIFEYLAPKTWSHLVIHTFHVPAYNAQVLKSSTQIQVESFAPAGSRTVLRIGSVLLNPIVLGPWLLIPLAIGLERVARGLASVGTAVALALTGAALILTQTRSAVLSAVVIVVLVALPAPGRDPVHRARFALAAVVLILLAVPVAMGVGFTARSSSAVNGSDASTQGHINSFYAGIDTLVATPLGRGLGTAAGVGSRTDQFGRVTTENYYLQVGDELGLFGMVPFVLFAILSLVHLGRGQRAGPGAVLRSGVWTAAVALAINAFLLQIWGTFVIAMTFWLVAGVAVGLADADRGAGRRSDARGVAPADTERRDGHELVLMRT
jgi:O-antigen ligase/polysaccharide polymerase Wzy-like membrane protein